MTAFFNIAQMSDKTGIDFWNYTSPSGKSLKKAFNELLPYLSQQKKWDGQQIKEFDYEEGFQILATGYTKFACKKCMYFIKKIAANKSPNLLINLLY